MAEQILLVDDDETLRETIKAILELENYKVIEARNGIEALDILKTQKVDIVLSDVIMPLLNGFELLERIQLMGQDRPAVIMMTGFSKQSPSDFLKIGALSFLQKPVSTEDLLKVIRSIKRSTH